MDERTRALMRAYGTDGRAALARTFGPADGEPVVRGIDLATIEDGLVVALETLLAR